MEMTMEPHDSAGFHEFLLDMDFDEYIPVNNFFSGYIQALDADSQSGSRPPVASNLAAPMVPPPSGELANGAPPQLGTEGENAMAQLPAGQTDPYNGAATPATARGGPATSQMTTTSNDTSLHGTDAGGSRGKKGEKTVRQQALNKVAQQRYRERKKAKAKELEVTVAALNQEISDLTTVARENEEMQAKLQAAQGKLASQHAQEVISGAAYSSTTDASASEGAARFHASIDALRTFLTTNGLMNGCSSQQSSIAPHLLERLKPLVHECYAACTMVHHHMIEVDVKSMIEASVDKVQQSFESSSVEWDSLVRRLNLSDRSRQTARALQAQYMQRAERLYAERHELNLEAVKVLLPADIGGTSVPKRDWFAPHAFFHRHRNAFRTTSVMQRLRANLSGEQRALAELDALVFTRLLDEMQTATCMLFAYPHHCSVLPLLNAITTDGDAVEGQGAS